MTREEAMRKAATRAASLAPGLPATHASPRFIELRETTSDGDVSLRDCLVWVVRFAGGARWLELALRESDGEVVRVQASRGGLSAPTEDSAQRDERGAPRAEPRGS